MTKNKHVRILKTVEKVLAVPNGAQRCQVKIGEEVRGAR